MTDREIVILVPNPARTAVLTTDDGRLPRATASDWRTTDQLDAVEARLGSRPPVLRIVIGPLGADGEAPLRLADMDTIGPDAPAGCIWTATDRLDLARATPTELQDAAHRAIGRYRDGPGPQDPPWSHPGWLARASTWMTDRMRERGSPASGPPRVVYLWGIAIVLRAPSPAGAMFLKCSAPIFRQEAAVTGTLAKATPDLVSRVAAVEPDEGWLLMDDHGERSLGERPADDWAVGLDRLARMQLAWTGRTDDLVRAGAPVRPIAELATALPGFATRAPVAAHFSAEDHRSWDAALPALVAACHRLDELGPEPTLVHGDFHPWNVTDEPSGPRIFDWTDAAISHPFTDLAVYATRPEDVATRRATRDAYLARWVDRMDPAALIEAGDLAIVVGTLYQVDSYLRILESLDLDDLWDLGPAAASWARSAVAALDEGIDLARPGHADG